MANCGSFPARKCKRELPDKVVAVVKAKGDKVKGVIRARLQVKVVKARGKASRVGGVAVAVETLRISESCQYRER